jgi:N-glycosylase/DNA lyase
MPGAIPKPDVGSCQKHVPRSSIEIVFPVSDYDLRATLGSGQVFRWIPSGDGWIGIVGRRWVYLRSEPGGLRARVACPVADWQWLADYLQTGVDLDPILASFPKDPVVQQSIEACRGLRLLRQPPWECLASFMLSSSKQICQIQQVIALLSQRWGEPIPVPPGQAPAFAFPTPGQIAQCRENDLRACKMGFRAPYLLRAARQVADGNIQLEAIGLLGLEQARAELMNLAGVGEKIANCVLLFAYGYPAAFPIDVWIGRVLREEFWHGRRGTPGQLRRFVAAHFGPYAGYAQQYLFHASRMKKKAGIITE